MKSLSPLRVGLTAAGSIWKADKVAFQQFSRHVHLVAVTDLNPDAARKTAEEFPGTAICADPDALLDMDEVDAVLILTVHSEHAALAHAALKAGKHVLIEKPMACDLADAQALVDAAEARDLRLMIGQCQRYDRKAGGGIVISVCVHRLDLVRFCLGEVRRARQSRGCPALGARLPLGQGSRRSATTGLGKRQELGARVQHRRRRIGPGGPPSRQAGARATCGRAATRIT